MIRLLRIYSWSYLKTEKLTAFLTLIGAILGVAVSVAIRVSNESALNSFRDSTRAVVGEDVVSIVHPSGEVSEKIIPELLRLVPFGAVRPYSSRFVEVEAGGGSLGFVQLIGIDLVSEEGARKLASGNQTMPVALTSEEFRKKARSDHADLVFGDGRRGVTLSDKLPNGAMMKIYGGNVLVVDISDFQEITDRFGYVHRLTLSGLSHETRRKVEEFLPSPLKLSDQQELIAQGETMVEAFRVNLNFLAAISLFVCVLLIYNTVSYSTLKRRKEFGILLAIGCSPRKLLKLIVLECFVFGLVSSILGVVLGYALSAIALRFVSQTLTALYMPISAASMQVSLWLAMQSIILGTFVSLLGGLIPALGMRGVESREILYYQTVEDDFHRLIPLLSALGIVALALSFVSATDQLLKLSVYLGFLAPATLLIGSMLVVPGVLKLIFRRRVVSSVPLALAIDHIRMTLRRNSVAVGAAIISIGMFVGVSTMIVSFRNTVEKWISSITRADIYISAGGSIGSVPSGYIPDEVVSYASNMSLDHDFVSSRELVLDGRKVRVSGVNEKLLWRSERELWLTELDEEAWYLLSSDPNVAAVSESFTRRFNLRIGDNIDIPTQSGIHSFRVGNVFFDYSSDQGVILIPFGTFEELFAESRKQGVSLYGVEDRSETIEAIRRRFPDLSLVIRDNISLRKHVLEVFDQTFSITYALQAIALLISGLTIFNAMLMLILERKREFGVFRAIGASSGAISKMVIAESMLLGAFSLLGGLIEGILLSLLLVYVVNRHFFGWSVEYSISFPLMLSTLIGATVISFLAGYFPGRHLSKRLDASVLRYE